MAARAERDEARRALDAALARLCPDPECGLRAIATGTDGPVAQTAERPPRKREGAGPMPAGASILARVGGAAASMPVSKTGDAGSSPARPAKAGRVYKPKGCGWPGCRATFAPTGPNALYCDLHSRIRQLQAARAEPEPEVEPTGWDGREGLSGYQQREP